MVRFTCLLLSLAACTSTGFRDADISEPAACTDADDPGIEVGDCAPEFELPNTDGEMVSLAAHRGEVVLVDISAMWCSTCRALAEDVGELANEFDQGFVPIGVIIQDIAYNTPTTEHAGEWIDFLNLSYEVVADVDGEFFPVWDPHGFVPGAYIIDTDGRIVWRSFAGNDSAEIAEELNALLP